MSAVQIACTNLVNMPPLQVTFRSTMLWIMLLSKAITFAILMILMYKNARREFQNNLK